MHVKRKRDTDIERYAHYARERYRCRDMHRMRGRDRDTDIEICTIGERKMEHCSEFDSVILILAAFVLAICRYSSLVGFVWRIFAH